MRQSQLFTTTTKTTPKDEVSLNAKLLIQAGFINKEMAGVYTYLPLGLRVFKKIENIIREEMNVIGGQEVVMTALQNPENWKATDRWNDEVIDVWFKTKLKNGTEVGLATTHEEPLASLMKNFINSYKTLPAYVYQFQTKFRNEIRSKSGIMRGREFVMKDLYSFNADQKGLDEFYDRCAEAYEKIFTRVGIGDKTYRTFASGGSFCKYSHEFQTVSEAGEDIIYIDKKKNIAINKEVFTDEVLSELNIDKKEVEEAKAIEVGNIFKLGTKYSEALGLKYTTENGEQKPVVMGCYGIGPGRLMGTIVELSNDKGGIIWPESIAPFRVHLIELKSDYSKVHAQAEKIYNELSAQNIEVFYDDRMEVSAGEKFADSDLIGCPNRVVVSEKTLAQDSVELKRRDSKEVVLVKIGDLARKLIG